MCHLPDSMKNTFDKVEGEEVSRIPCPKHWDRQFPSVVEKSVTDADNKVACDNNHHRLKNQIEGQVVYDGNVDKLAGTNAENCEKCV